MLCDGDTVASAISHVLELGITATPTCSAFTQPPAAHASPAAHALPHLPQCRGSDCSDEQVPAPHDTWPTAQHVLDEQLVL